MVTCWEYQSVSEPNQEPEGISSKMRMLPSCQKKQQSNGVSPGEFLRLAAENHNNSFLLLSLKQQQMLSSNYESTL